MRIISNAAIVLALGLGASTCVFLLARNRDTTAREKALRDAGVVYRKLETDRVLPSPEIAFVAVRNPHFGDADVPLISSLRVVRAIDVSDTALTAEGLVELLHGRNKLLHLDVSGVHLGTAGAAAIG